MELRQIPEVNLEAEVQPDGTVLVTWDTPPDYVEVQGWYDSFIVGRDGDPVTIWHTGTFDDKTGSSFVIDDWPASGTALYLQVNVWFSDPEGLGDVATFAGPYDPFGDVNISGTSFGAPVYWGEFDVEASE